MTSAELENLVRIGKLKLEPPSTRELTGLLDSARARLADAANTALAFDSRFDLAYNASHALALYALRRAGYRCDARYLAFQTLPHTLGLPAEVWRVLAKAHERRNLAEYEGHLERDDRLLADLLVAARRLQDAIDEHE
jgi:MoxR-like ATPase